MPAAFPRRWPAGRQTHVGARPTSPPAHMPVRHPPPPRHAREPPRRHRPPVMPRSLLATIQ
eukprot:11202575-Lingulodinium_polyedra.AAC.1